MRGGQFQNKGQIVVLLVVGIVVLIGFAALAIDGSIYYADRRFDQNTADSSALAAAGKAAQLLDQYGIIFENFDCVSINENTALINGIGAEAINVAAINNFSVSQYYSMPDKHGVYVDCVEEAVTGSYQNYYLDIYVKISSETKSGLSSVIFNGILENQVTSVARISPKTSMGYGMAIVALNDSCSPAVEGLVISGDSTITIANNGGHTNGCLTINGGVDVISDQSITYIDTYIQNGLYPPSPTPELVEEPMIPWIIDPPDCSETEQGKVIVTNSEDIVIPPGTYKGITLTGGKLSLSPGLYCLTADFKITGGELKIYSGNPHEGVTIFMGNGGFTSAGEAHITLQAADDEGTISLANGAIPGMLMYVPPENPEVIKLIGDSSSTYEGTVYAPTSDIHIGGASDTMSEYGTQIIGLNVNVNGGTDITIEFSGDNIYHFNENIQLEE